MFSFSLPAEIPECETLELPSEVMSIGMESYMPAQILKASTSQKGSDVIRIARAPIAEEEEKISFYERLIVAVDDHPMNIDVLEMIIVKKLERQVTCCLSGEEAIAEIQQRLLLSRDVPLKILVLMDVNMPLMNGIETTKKIKKLLVTFRNVQATFVALSAQEEKTVKGVEIFDAYRTKPVAKDDIEEVLLTYGF